MILSPSNQYRNSSYLIAALERNMQKIREETEISLKRLIELNEIINAPNETFAKDLQNLGSQLEMSKMKNHSDMLHALNRSHLFKTSRETVPPNPNQRAVHHNYAPVETLEMSKVDPLSSNSPREGGFDTQCDKSRSR